MGAGKQPELFDQTRDYLVGFIVGAPGSMGALVLVPFLQMAGKSGLLIAAVLGMTVADIALDLLNVLVFHGGMFGMGLASSLSYYVAMVIAMSYFLSKKCVFSFSLKRITLKKIREHMGLTQREMAMRLMLSGSQYREWEKLEERIKALCLENDLDVDDFIGVPTIEDGSNMW